MSWESTVPYYRTINRVVGERLGGLHSAKILLYSVDFAEIEQFQRQGDWNEAGMLLAGAGRVLQAMGADFLVMCTNTMHRVSAQIEAAISIPLLHIADATGEVISSTGIARVGLIGTRFTMEGEFYRRRLEDRYGLEVLVPPESDRIIAHRIIYAELCRGRRVEESRSACRRITAALVARGCAGIILGCTEVGLLLQSSDAVVPLFDTAEIHAERAALHALEPDRA